MLYKSDIENSTNHFCEGTRQNALAALTNLGHITPILSVWTPYSHIKINYTAYKCIYVSPLMLPHYVYKPVNFLSYVAHDVCHNEH